MNHPRQHHNEPRIVRAVISFIFAALFVSSFLVGSLVGSYYTDLQIKKLIADKNIDCVLEGSTPRCWSLK